MGRMIDKKRIPAAPRAPDRAKIRDCRRANRLTVHRTNAHIYASVISPTGRKVLAAPRPSRSRRARGPQGQGRQRPRPPKMVGSASPKKRAKAAGIEPGGVRPRRLSITTAASRRWPKPPAKAA
jgi:large subunit ribosomal protein L18